MRHPVLTTLAAAAMCCANAAGSPRIMRPTSAREARLGSDRRLSVQLPLVLILYVPATIAPVLTNMRYTITVQPLMFIFVAITLVTAYETWRGERPGARRSATA